MHIQYSYFFNGIHKMSLEYIKLSINLLQLNQWELDYIIPVWFFASDEKTNDFPYLYKKLFDPSIKNSNSIRSTKVRKNKISQVEVVIFDVYMVPRMDPRGIHLAALKGLFYYTNLLNAIVRDVPEYKRKITTRLALSISWPQQVHQHILQILTYYYFHRALGIKSIISRSIFLLHIVLRLNIQLYYNRIR